MTTQSGWRQAHIVEIAEEVRDSVTPIAGELYQLWSVPSYAAGEPEILDGSDIGSTKLKVQPWDVLVCKINPRINRVWIVQENSLGLPQIASPEWLVLRFPVEGRPVMASFMAKYLSGPDFRHWITGAVSGVTGSHTRAKSKDILQQKVPIPPLAEQQRIAEKLEGFLSSIDGLGKSLAELRGKVSNLVLHTIDLAARGSQVATLNSGAGAELQRRAESRKFDYSSLEGLPDGWAWRSSAQVCQAIVCGSTPQANLMTPDSGDIPFLKVYNISQEGYLDFGVRPTFVSRETHNGQLARSRVFPGDVLTNIVGPPLGKTAVVPSLYPEWNINQAIVAFRPGPELHGEWLALVLRSPFIVDKLKGTARATAGQFNISLSACRELPVPIPPLERQVEIVRHVNHNIAMAESAAESIKSTLLGMRRLRAAALAAAFRGDLL